MIEDYTIVPMMLVQTLTPKNIDTSFLHHLMGTMAPTIPSLMHPTTGLLETIHIGIEGSIRIDAAQNTFNIFEKLYHTLDVTRALKYYLHRTQFPKRPTLFVSYSYSGSQNIFPTVV